MISVIGYLEALGLDLDKEVCIYFNIVSYGTYLPKTKDVQKIQ